MNNPFIFGKTVSGGQFIDREDETASIVNTLASGQNIICYSPRRYGKTSLMLKVKEELCERGHLVFFIDLFRITSLDNLYSIYATSIAAALRSPLKALLEILHSVLPTINPKVVFKGEGSPTVEVSMPLPVLAKSATLRELFDSL